MPGLLPGKDYVAWGEFEELLASMDMGERDFVAHFRLGLYSVREWRRKGFAPYWAAEAARLLSGRAAGPLTIAERGMLFAKLSADEMAKWEEAESQGDSAAADAILMRHR